MTVDLSSLPPLPPLPVPPFPTVTPTPSCTTAPFPPKVCFDVPIVTVRPFAFPTVPLASLALPWIKRTSLSLPDFPVAPSLGVQCSTITSSTTATSGAAGVVAQSVSYTNSDACRPNLTTTLVFPCTQVNPSFTLLSDNTATGQSGFVPVDTSSTSGSSATCGQNLIYQLFIPGCTAVANNPNAGQQNYIALADPRLPSGRQNLPALPAGGPTSVAPGQFSRQIVGNPDLKCGVLINDIIGVPCSTIDVQPADVVTHTGIIPAIEIVDGKGNPVPGASGSMKLTIPPIDPANPPQPCTNQLHVGFKLVFADGLGGGLFDNGMIVGVKGENNSDLTGPPLPDYTTSSVTAYGPGAVVPIFDTYGSITGIEDTDVDSTANAIINGSSAALSVGDFVSIAQYPNPDLTSTVTLWQVYPL